MRTPTPAPAETAVGDAAVPDGPADDALVAAWRAGDAAAFERLYARYAQRVWRYCYRALGFEHDAAADAAQMIWEKVLGAIDRYRAEGHFDRWLFAIAHHALVDQQRRQRPDAADIGSVPLADGEDFTRRYADCEHLQAALDSLPLAQRSAVLLHYTEGFTLAEIAEFERVGRETVKSRLRYGLNALRRWLGEADAP